MFTTFSHRWSFVFAGVAVLNALLFAAKDDWATAAIAAITAGLFVLTGIRKLKKRDNA